MAATTHFYETFQPEHYDLYININRADKLISGKSTITGDAQAQEVLVHQNGLTIASVQADGADVPFTVDNDIQGIKLHLLHLMTNTRMQRDYHEGRLKLLSQEEYVSIICDQLEIIPKDIVIHRITGDAPRDMLIGPMWSLNKWEVLNAIDKEMERRDSWQGCKVANEKEEKA